MQVYFDANNNTAYDDSELSSMTSQGSFDIRKTIANTTSMGVLLLQPAARGTGSLSVDSECLRTGPWQDASVLKCTG